MSPAGVSRGVDLLSLGVVADSSGVLGEGDGGLELEDLVHELLAGQALNVCFLMNKLKIHIKRLLISKFGAYFFFPTYNPRDMGDLTSGNFVSWLLLPKMLSLLFL